MKKLITLLLAAVVCLSLAACGGEKTPISGNQGGQQMEEGTADHIKTNPDHPFLQFLYGEWEYEGDHKDNFPFAKLTVHADGTCVADDAAGVWKISDRTSDGRLYIDVLVDDQVIGAAEIYVWAGKYSFDVPDVMINPGDTWNHHTAVTPDENDITLTTENWREYFDLITETTYSENAFGEMDGLTLVQHLVPKEEYASKIFATDVVYQLESTKSQYPINLNSAEKTYELGEVVSTGEPLTSEPAKLWCNYESNRYQISVTTNRIDAAENANADSTVSETVWLVPEIEDINMVRIQGNLYIVND